jgi:hypothetical protein
VEGEESLPDTNGDVAVYVTRRIINGVSESDIAWQPLTGGEAQVLALPGPDTNPSVSGSLIAFERRDPSSSSPNYDVMLYDLRSQVLYRLTNTPESESLSDISVEPDGLARVVWTVRQNGDLNLYAFVFRLPGDCEPPTIGDPAAVCASPGARPLVGSLQVTRSTSEPEVVSTPIEASGTGVLCVDNGHEGTRATEGWVWLSGGLKVGPEDFGEDVEGLAQVVPLQGPVLLSAQVDAAAGSAFQVRLYGDLTCDLGPDGGSGDDAESRQGEVLVPIPLAAGLGRVEGSHYFVPSGYEGVVTTSGKLEGSSHPE